MLSRFVRFNVVGAIGFALQIALLTLLVRAGMPVVAATVVAVEAAVLHNFAWHERWTWGRKGALGRFHLTNGAISLTGNIVLTPLLVSAGVPLVAANVSAVLACALINFLAAQLIVFGRGGAKGAEPVSAPLRPPRSASATACDLCRGVVRFPSYGSPRIRRSSTRAWLTPRTRAAPSS